MAVTDPLGELVDALWEHRKPSLEWVLRWSQDGKDPVIAAWEAERNKGEMADLVWRVAGSDFRDIMKRYRRFRRRYRGQGHCVAWRYAWTPPTLPEILRAMEESWHPW